MGCRPTSSKPASANTNAPVHAPAIRARSFEHHKAGFRLRRVENVYLDVVKIIEAVKHERVWSN
jgi:hypothetical protein